MPATALSRRELLTGAAATLSAAQLRAAPAPAAPVAIARCRAYDSNLTVTLGRMFDQAGGIGSLVRGKTVTIKPNLTGNPARFPVEAAYPYRTNPDMLLAAAHLMARAGARRIRIVETFFPATQDMDLWGRYGIDIDAMNNVGCKVEWENAQNLGQARKYARLKPASGGYMFPSYDLNHSWADTDVYVSMSKLKHHWIAGVTMSLKNNFGITPCSLYGSDCGASGNEDPKQERVGVCHMGRVKPSGRSGAGGRSRLAA